MESYKIKNLSFAYTGADSYALKNISLTIKKGEFVTICGKSGCGKTTLLRLLKSCLAPSGVQGGEILFCGKTMADIDDREQASKIGFVLQNPDSQIVTDKVWHELAFGVESLGYSTPEIRTKVSEMASFFGIQNWFYKRTNELSGGQKQMLNLASVMVMQPEVLILDEPTSQLDPIAASEFLKTLQKINDELGTTIILTEHRLEEALVISDRIIVMDEGEIAADGDLRSVTQRLKEKNHDMYDALPVPMRVFDSVESEELPLTIREGQAMLLEYSKTHEIDKAVIKMDNQEKKSEPVIEVKDVFFRYDKDLPDVVKGFNLTVKKGEFVAILGGNGTGKTTAISLISGINTQQRGEIYINGEKLSKIPDLYNGLLGVLPQNPQGLFARKTVLLDLFDMTDKECSKEERDKKVYDVAKLCRIEKMLNRHPYDLSGGEKQRAALAMILLKQPQILIMDEPTKGMDVHFKRIFANILKDLNRCGVTILMVSHDIEFCAEYAEKCALFFDGAITSAGESKSFFRGNAFYTTSANRMARKIIPEAVLAEDIIAAMGGKMREQEKQVSYTYQVKAETKKEPQKPVFTLKRIILGAVFALWCIALCMMHISAENQYDMKNYVVQGAALIFAALSVACFLPQKELGGQQIQVIKTERKLNKRTIVAALMVLVAIPFTIYFGIYYLGDKKYYFISLLIILETILPFCMMIESRKPQAREIVIISVLCALGVAGRTVFYMLPEFKPVVALVIISGICFGGETGFLVGAMTGFVSNFFFGHGPWTPWQMFAFGVVGFIAGVLFKKGFLVKTRVSLSVFGFIATLLIYGGVMNPASVLMMTTEPTWDMIATSFVLGFPIDLIHAMSTAVFLWFISEPMIEKLERVKTKYGVTEIGS